MKVSFIIFLSFVTLIVNVCSQSIIDNVKSSSNLSEHKLLNEKITTTLDKLNLKSSLNISSAEVTKYKNSEIFSVVIPYFNNTENFIVIYSLNENISVCKAQLNKDIESNIETFKIKNLEGKHYFTIQKNSQNQVGGFLFGDNIINDDLLIKTDGNYGPSCPKQFPTEMVKCMDCAVKECGESWLCTLACAIGGTTTLIACFAGFALACGGVGTPL